jgi:cytochrome c biogenesis protein CcmG, thiol:disulfide interchange protein DsbE
VAERLKLGAQAVAVALVAGLLALLIWKVAQGSQKEAALGKVAPDFTLDRLDRPGSLQLSSLRGKVVVLNFWASWCYPCKREAPVLQAASKRWGDRVVVLGVDVNDPRGDARGFMRKYGFTYPIVQDNKNVTSPKYGLTGLPETFFLDRRGRVVSHVISEIKATELQRGVEEALRA